MSQLPTRDDFMQRKQRERDELARPQLQAQAIERELLAARETCWELLAEFIARARELSVKPHTWESPQHGSNAPRIAWVEGYPLESGSIVSAPPLRYCLTERRLVRRPLMQVVELEE